MGNTVQSTCDSIIDSVVNTVNDSFEKILEVKPNIVSVTSNVSSTQDSSVDITEIYLEDFEFTDSSSNEESSSLGDFEFIDLSFSEKNPKVSIHNGFAYREGSTSIQNNFNEFPYKEDLIPSNLSSFTVYNGVPVKKGWKEAGGRPNFLLFTHYGKFRLVLCPFGYVILCINDNCKNLAKYENFKCYTHNLGKESYYYCKYGTCFQEATFGHENNKWMYCSNHVGSNVGYFRLFQKSKSNSKKLDNKPKEIYHEEHEGNYHGEYEENYHGEYEENYHGEYEENYHGEYEENYHGEYENSIISNICPFPNCENEANWCKLYSNQNLTCCKHSSLNTYYNKRSHPRCQCNKCENIAYYINDHDEFVYPIRCQSHKFLSDIELVFKECQRCHDTLYFPFNRSVCMNCGRYRKGVFAGFKENLIKQFLITNNINFTHDRPISSNGTKLRPDFLLRSNFGYIIVEVDEHQHRTRGYSYETEIDRMKRIYQDIKLVSLNAQVLFIRFNPDKYYGGNISLKQRCEHLYSLIENFIFKADIGYKLAKITLYYDGYKNVPIKEPIPI